MSQLTPAAGLPATRSSRPALLGAAFCLVLAVAGLTWAKWAPYAHRLDLVAATHLYPGHSTLAAAGDPGDAPSLSSGWRFTLAYGRAIWPALAVALTLAAATQALLPREWLVGPLGGRYPTARGGLSALPTMMCTCCTAPLVVTLRRSGASLPAALAYWVGSPTLNPAVIALMAVLFPWQWVATRLVVGVFLVFGVTAWIARASGAHARPRVSDDADVVPSARLADALGRFGRALARFTFTLVPEYFVVVLAVGTFHGWLFPFDGSHWALVAIPLAAILGTLIVIPTAGEIPVLQGLAAAGAGSGLLGTLLIVLPAVSLPSLVMVARALSVRVTLLTAVAVMGSGLAGALLMWALP